jgi:hypothetical protein
MSVAVIRGMREMNHLGEVVGVVAGQRCTLRM